MGRSVVREKSQASSIFVYMVSQLSKTSLVQGLTPQKLKTH